MDDAEHAQSTVDNAEHAQSSVDDAEHVHLTRRAARGTGHGARGTPNRLLGTPGDPISMQVVTHLTQMVAK